MFVLLAQAILVGLLAEYFVGELTSENTRNAFLYGVGIVICSILSSFLHPHAFIKGQLTGTYVCTYVQYAPTINQVLICLFLRIYRGTCLRSTVKISLN